jgi:hypothetical protein
VTTPWILAFTVLAVVVLVTATVVAGLFRRVVLVLSDVERLVRAGGMSSVPGGLPVGSHIPGFVAAGEDDRSVDASEISRYAAIILLMDVDCEPCRSLAAQLSGVSRSDLGVDLVVVWGHVAGSTTPPLPEWAISLRQRDHEVAEAFATSATPHAFATDAKGIIHAQRIVNTVDHLMELARDLREEAMDQRGQVTAAEGPQAGKGV